VFSQVFARGRHNDAERAICYALPRISCSRFNYRYVLRFYVFVVCAYLYILSFNFIQNTVGLLSLCKHMRLSYMTPGIAVTPLASSSEVQSVFLLVNVYTLCLKKTTMTFYAITSMHINRFWQFVAEILLN